MPERALIFGVSGQDGSYLAQFLLKKGYEVHGTSRDHEVSTFGNLKTLGIKDRVHLRSMDASDFRSVLTTLQAVDAREIYNLGGQSSVGLSFAYPVETFNSISTGTINILECLRLLKHPARFYNAGSSEVFGNTPTAANEETPFRPRSPYATAKAAAHYSVANYREAYGLFACTGILFNHESPLRPARFVTRKIVSAAVRIAGGSNETLKLGNLNVHRDWGWAPEYVDVMWRILQQTAPCDFVVATGSMNSLKKFVEEVFAGVGLDWKDHVETDDALLRPSDIERSVGHPQKAREMLDWEASLDFKAIIAKLIEAEQARKKFLTDE
jgi:GDPmannose 4,6-dehydratase